MGRSAGFNLGGSYSAHRPQQQQHAPSVSSSSVSFPPGNSQDFLQLHGSDMFAPSNSTYHSQVCKFGPGNHTKIDKCIGNTNCVEGKFLINEHILVNAVNGYLTFNSECSDENENVILLIEFLLSCSGKLVLLSFIVSRPVGLLVWDLDPLILQVQSVVQARMTNSSNNTKTRINLSSAYNSCQLLTNHLGNRA